MQTEKKKNNPLDRNIKPSKILGQGLIMLLEPGHNPIDDPVLYKTGTAEYHDAYFVGLYNYMDNSKLPVNLAILGEDDYFELKDLYD